MDYKVSKIKLSPDEALQKMRSWCAYQERSHHESRQKLKQMGLEPEEAEAIIAALISENFLNEERFALALAGGKFRIKQWGKNRIRQELAWHRVSEYSINKALQSIDEDEYLATMDKVIEKKSRLLQGTDQRKKTHLLLTYLVSRGFESELVMDRLNELNRTASS